MIAFDCTGCGQRLQVKEALAGKFCNCPKCGGPLTVPVIPSATERAKQLFHGAELAFPTIPAVLTERLKEQGNWLFSTRTISISPYDLGYYVREFDETPVKDYAVLCHAGHGVNSYAISYYLVHGPLAMFLQLGWGGVYMDAKKATDQIADCFALADQIVSETQTPGKFPAGARLKIVTSDFYGSHWSVLGQGRKEVGTKASDDQPPAQVLTEALSGYNRAQREHRK